MSAAMEKTRPTTFANLSLLERAALQYEVEQFLYFEASLLDARKYRDWFGLIAKDIHYWMPIRRTVTLANIEREFTQPGAMAFFDDDHMLLEMRVKKLEATSAWAEDPPSRSRHFVSNVRILEMNGDEITLECCFRLTRMRLESELSEWIGRRLDVLRRNGASFLIAKRHLFLDHTVIRSTNMSTIF